MKYHIVINMVFNHNMVSYETVIYWHGGDKAGGTGTGTGKGGDSDGMCERVRMWTCVCMKGRVAVLRSA